MDLELDKQNIVYGLFCSLCGHPVVPTAEVKLDEQGRAWGCLQCNGIPVVKAK